METANVNNQEKQSRLEEFIQNPKKSLWKLAIPMMLGMSVNAIYILADTAFIGWWVEGNGLSAIGFVWPFIFTIMGLTFGLSSGATALIARYIGQKNKDLANTAASQTIIIGVICSIIIIIFTLIFKKNIFIIQGADEKTATLAYDYFRILGLGSIFLILSMFIRAILSGEGDNKYPMIFLGIGTLINIALDPILIHLYGISGAAFATVISQMISCLIFFYYILVRKGSYLDFSLKKFFEIHPKMINNILAIGIPQSLSMFIMSGGAGIFNYILSYDKIDPFNINVGAFQLAGRIEHLFFIVIISISSSLVTLVGMYYGAKRFDLIKKIVQYGISSAVLFACICVCFFFFLAEDIVPMFAKDESKETIITAIGFFSIVSFSYPFVTIGMTSSRIMQGLGYPKPVLIITFIRVILINAPLGLLLTRYMNYGIEYIWYCILLSSFIASVIAILWMRKIINLKMAE